MKDFVKRMIEEQKEVEKFVAKTQNRMVKLEEFVHTDKFANLSKIEQCLLYQQYLAMKESVCNLDCYQSVLEDRIDFYTKED